MKGRRDGFRIPNRLSACASRMLHLARSTAVPFGLRTPPRISAVHQGLRRQQPRRSGRCDGRQLTRHTSLHALIHFVWSWMAQRMRWSATVLFYGTTQHEERIKSAFFFGSRLARPNGGCESFVRTDSICKPDTSKHVTALCSNSLSCLFAPVAQSWDTSVELEANSRISKFGNRRSHRR